MPISIESMVSRTRVSRLLAGWRDTPAVDEAALHGVLVAVSVGVAVAVSVSGPRRVFFCNERHLAFKPKNQGLL